MSTTLKRNTTASNTPAPATDRPEVSLEATEQLLAARQHIGNSGITKPAPIVPMSRSRASLPLEALIELGVPAPIEAAAELTEHAKAYDLLANVMPAPEPIDFGHIFAVDIEERLREFVMADLAHRAAEPLRERMLEHLDKMGKKILAKARPVLFEGLRAVYAEQAERFWKADSEHITGAERDDRQALRANITTAHTAFVGHGPDDWHRYHAQPFLHFEFTNKAWGTYREDALPGGGPRGNLYDYAVNHCGATPRLARSYQQAIDEWKHAHEATQRPNPLPGFTGF